MLAPAGEDNRRELLVRMVRALADQRDIFAGVAGFSSMPSTSAHQDHDAFAARSSPAGTTRRLA